jgi:hypothetical protein
MSALSLMSGSLVHEIATAIRGDYTEENVQTDTERYKCRDSMIQQPIMCEISGSHGGEHKV